MAGIPWYTVAEGESSEDQVISFKVTTAVAKKLAKQGKEFPVTEGFKPLSIHQAARAFMIQGLEAHIAGKEEEE